MEYIKSFLADSERILTSIDQASILEVINELRDLRERRGRLFLLGVGGGAAHASHAACDFRKISGIEAYAPTDNVSELTARVNDDGWETAFEEWLKVSRLGSQDGVLIISVGGGDVERNVSVSLVRALEHAQRVNATILGIVGRDGGYTAKVAKASIIVPPVNPGTVTPQTEAFQALIWHLIVSHPVLKQRAAKWESLR